MAKKAGRAISVSFEAPVEKDPKGTPSFTQLTALGGDGSILATALVEDGRGTIRLPGSLAKNIIVFHSALIPNGEPIDVERLRKVEAVEYALPSRPTLTKPIKLPPLLPVHWRECRCRVRGTVRVRVVLGNDIVRLIPLCNARIVICDINPRLEALISSMSVKDLARLRRDWFRAIEFPDLHEHGDPELPKIDDETQRLGELLRTSWTGKPPHDHAGHDHGEHDHAGHAHDAAPAKKTPRVAKGRHGTHGAVAHAPEPDPNIKAELSRILDVRDPRELRELLLKHVEWLKPFWCRFPWVWPYYSKRCLNPIPIGPDGRFDLTLWYLCDLGKPFFHVRIEQACLTAGWRVVYTSSLPCHFGSIPTCGTDITITVNLAGVGLGPSAALAIPYNATDPASVGQWQLLPYDSQVFVVHTAVLRTGKVLIFSGTAEVNYPLESRVWDPGTGAFTAQAFPVDLFCAGQSFLADGTLLVAGGAPSGILDTTFLFDPAAETWTQVQDMNRPRWYPTVLTLPDSRVLAISGNGGQSNHEVFTAGAGWTALPATADKTFALYPSHHLMPDGTVFSSGTSWDSYSPPAPSSARINAALTVWTDVAAHVEGDRTEGMSVLLPEKAAGAEPWRVMVIGGSRATGAGRPDTAEIIDLSQPNPAWTLTAPMSTRRTNVGALILPDATVLVIGGHRTYKWNANPDPVYEAELFDPAAGTWTTLVSMSVARQYHSTAVLLPDGRVLTCGSIRPSPRADLRDMEIYSPPYLFRGPRPRLSSAPAVISYNNLFAIDSPDVCRIHTVVLMRPMAVTHHTDTEQRYLSLTFQLSGQCQVRARAPRAAQVAPPGYYMLFVVDDAGIPSVGRFVKLQ